MKIYSKKGLFSTVVENSNFQNVYLYMYMIYDGTIPMPFLNFFECAVVVVRKKKFSLVSFLKWNKYIRCTFSSNPNFPQSSFGLVFWASDPLIDRFY